MKKNDYQISISGPPLITIQHQKVTAILKVLFLGPSVLLIYLSICAPIRPAHKLKHNRNHKRKSIKMYQNQFYDYNNIGK